MKVSIIKHSSKSSLKNIIHTNQTILHKSMSKIHYNISPEREEKNTTLQPRYHPTVPTFQSSSRRPNETGVHVLLKVSLRLTRKFPAATHTLPSRPCHAETGQRNQAPSTPVFDNLFMGSQGCAPPFLRFISTTTLAHHIREGRGAEGGEV